MNTFLSHRYHIYLQEFVAALAMLGLGLEGLSGDQGIPSLENESKK